MTTLSIGCGNTIYLEAPPDFAREACSFGKPSSPNMEYRADMRVSDNLIDNFKARKAIFGECEVRFNGGNITGHLRAA